MAKTITQKLQTLSHSRIQTFKTCRRKHFFRYDLGIRTPSDEKLRFGGMFHEALDMLKRGCRLQDALSLIVQNYITLREAAATEEFDAALDLECEKCLRMTEGWHWRWSKNNVEFIESEIPFELPIVNPETGRPSRTYLFNGKIDAIVQLYEPSRKLIGEHKTTSEDISSGSPFWKRLRLDTQITGYMVAATDLGYDVSGIFFDATRKPSIRPKRIKGIVETIQEYGERLMQDIYDRPDFYYQQVEVPRTQDDLDEFRTELWQIAKDMQHAKINGHHFKNSQACTMPFRCEYLDPCSTGFKGDGAIPDGFIKLENVHPELTNGNNSTSPARGDNQNGTVEKEHVQTLDNQSVR